LSCWVKASARLAIIENENFNIGSSGEDVYAGVSTEVRANLEKGFLYEKDFPKICSKYTHTRTYLRGRQLNNRKNREKF
jgi:hypothetical protein